jgi:FMN phosphatase YigB (HAD superfamily)
MAVYNQLNKRHDYLICIDSDGCAMDTMKCEHFHCYGPCMVMEWELDQWRVEILERWNEINLFQMTRGINRYKALALALSEVDENFVTIPGVQTLKAWAENVDQLSSDALQAAIAITPDLEGKECLRKAMAWSEAVNDNILMLPDDLKPPFRGVKKALVASRVMADIVVIGDNRDKVNQEWNACSFMMYVDSVFTRDQGGLDACLTKAEKLGYDPGHILLVGDTPIDLQMAEEKGICFYPILVGHEKQSWFEFVDRGLEWLTSGDYDAYQFEKKAQFLKNLSEDDQKVEIS